MVVPARFLENKSEDLESVAPKEEAVRRKAAELYGQGWKRREIARILLNFLAPRRDIPKESRVKDARRKLAKWEKQQEFRDLVWDTAVVELDMSTPEILKGVASKAKRGRVDAAKMALGITGRYKERDDDRPGSIQINISGMPRPDRQLVDAPQADITLRDDEYTEDS